MDFIQNVNLQNVNLQNIWFYSILTGIGIVGGKISTGPVNVSTLDLGKQNKTRSWSGTFGTFRCNFAHFYLHTFIMWERGWKSV